MIEETVRTPGHWFLVLFAVALAIVAAAWFIFAIRVVTPIKRLQVGIRRIGSGDLDHRIPLRSRDEIGDIAAALNGMAESLKALTVSRDRLAAEVTVRTAVEGQLAQANDELKRSNEDLEQFAYIASHDLQEPLRKIQAFGDRLLARLQGDLDDVSADYLRRMREASARMQNMINGLLDHSRVTTRGKDLVPTESRDALELALKDLEVSLEEAKAMVTFGPLPTVVADRDQVVRLFQNLIGNAVKFRSDRPLLIEIWAERAGDGWQFTVKDNGIGIDLTMNDRIFQMFQRLHARRDIPGSGMGLSICKRIVERHGGRIWVGSAPGEGSAFHFTLPAPPAEPAPYAVVRPRRTPWRQEASSGSRTRGLSWRAGPALAVAAYEI